MLLYWELGTEADGGPSSTLDGRLVYTMHQRATATPQQVTPADRVRALGRDKKWSGDREVGHSGDWILVQGDSALKQAIYLCLITVPGEYGYRPEYGAGLLAYIGKPVTEALKDEIKGRIRAALQRLKRIEAVDRISIEAPDSESLKIHMLIRAVGRPINLDPLLLRRPNT